MEIVVYNPGYNPVVYTLTGLTLYPGSQAKVVPDARTVSQLAKGRIVDITPPAAAPDGEDA